jgi:acyl-CoA synthetase (AMP-forming)/AMP-acid ligase II
MAGYYNLPDQTCEAWRNLWFHTGDAGYIDSDGFVFFIDRIRDCIRRRGHNISSFEIERAILSLEGVAEVAAYPVPSKAVQAAGSLERSAVAAKVRELPVSDAFVKNGAVREDGRMLHDMLLGQVKSPKEVPAADDWDLFKIIATIPAAEATRPLPRGECPFVK